MGTQVRQCGGAAAEILRDGAGLQTAQAQPHIPRGGGHRLQKVDERLAVFQVVTPAGDLDAGEHQLPVALLPQLLRLGHRLRLGQRAHRPAGVGDDAVGAEVDAAIFYLQHSAGALGHAAGGQHLERPALQRIVQQRDLLLPAHLLQQLQKRHAVAGTRHEVNVQRRRLLRMGLHIATAGGHHRLRIQLPAAPQHLPRFFIADGSDRAGVDDIDVRLFIKRYQRVAPAHQLLLHGLRLVLIDLTA